MHQAYCADDPSCCPAVFVKSKYNPMTIYNSYTCYIPTVTPGMSGLYNYKFVVVPDITKGSFTYSVTTTGADNSCYPMVCNNNIRRGNLLNVLSTFYLPNPYMTNTTFMATGPTLSSILQPGIAKGKPVNLIYTDPRYPGLAAPNVLLDAGDTCTIGVSCSTCGCGSIFGDQLCSCTCTASTICHGVDYA